MPIHPNVRQCTHIQITGHRCGSPALKQEYFCYFHTRMIKGVPTRVDSQIHPIALIENAEAIQAALMHMVDAVLKGTIDNKRANIVLKALHIAVRNSRNVRFNTCQYDMVHEVPNYAQQYLSEHPELNPPEPNTHAAPDAHVRGAEQSSAGSTHNLDPETQIPENATSETEDLNPAKDCHPEAAQAFAKRRPANEGSMHLRSPRQSEENCEKPCDDTIPPLTNRQTEQREEIKKLETAIEGAMRGNWRDLRTVFNAVGLTPRKPPASSSHRKAGGSSQATKK
jgi:hypothetical protein